MYLGSPLTWGTVVGFTLSLFQLVPFISGIQQYLFENGRIDNIFTDIYFEKFTEFLNEVLTMYEPKLNTAGKLSQSF